MSGIAFKISPDGNMERLEVPEPGETLPWLYRNIGCNLVDVVGMPQDLDFWLDDEGLYPEPNIMASLFALNFGVNLAAPIVGNVILAKHDGQGNTVGLDMAEAAAFLLTLKAMIADANSAMAMKDAGVTGSGFSLN